MTPQECVALVRLVSALCPQQAIDRDTPKAWSLILDDVRLVDAREAVTALARRQVFIAPAEIRDEVKRIRAARLAGVVIVPPAELADDPVAEREWIVAERKRIADGGILPAPLEVEADPVRVQAIAAATFPRKPPAMDFRAVVAEGAANARNYAKRSQGRERRPCVPEKPPKSGVGAGKSRENTGREYSGLPPEVSSRAETLKQGVPR